MPSDSRYGWNGEGDHYKVPFRRSYKVKCPICGIGHGTKKRVGEHLENVHGIWPDKDGRYKIPKRW